MMLEILSWSGKETARVGRGVDEEDEEQVAGQGQQHHKENDNE
jgi:hypothetical protein